MSRLGTIIKWGIIAASVAGGWRFYQSYLESSSYLTNGRQEMEKGRYAAAVDYLEAAYNQDPDDLTICLDLAECSFRVGQERDALIWYRRAEPLLSRETSSISMMKHKERYTYLSQKGDRGTGTTTTKPAHRR